jgi:antitoxin component YwqK of YwqJK toxin-antitoxin module
MKTKFLYFILLMLTMDACNFENKVVEESYPDGSPKRICIYHGRGQNREMIKETTYYSNKQVQMDGIYKDGKREGKWTYWYENGKVWSEGTYKNGKAEGRRTAYFENGKVRIDGSYKEDNRIGKWSFFDENGRLLKEVDFSATR